MIDNETLSVTFAGWTDILDRIKDYEHRILEQRHRTFNGQVHHLEEPPEGFKQNSYDFLADQVVDACLVELNMLETPQQTTSWYLGFGATHHVSGDSSVFSLITQIAVLKSDPQGVRVIV